MARKAVAQINIGEDISINHYREVNITQTLFNHYQYNVQAPIEAIEGDGIMTFDKSKQLIGKSITISFSNEQIDGKKSQMFLGIVTEIGMARQKGYASDLVITAQSATILLDNFEHTRSFSEKKLKDIVEEVVKDIPSNLLEIELDPVFEGEIPYVVQYRETNYQFLCRLANLYGEWIFFNGSNLVFGLKEFPDPIDLILGSDLDNFDLKMRLKPVNYQYQFYNYETNELLKSGSSDQGDFKVDPVYGELAFNESSNLYTHAPLAINSQPIKDQEQLDAHVQRVLNQQTSGLVLLNGEGENIELSIGTTFTVSGSKGEDILDGMENYGNFVVIDIHHKIMGNGGYQNAFNAIPVDAGVPPLNPNIKKPYCEPQPAIVKENHDPDGLGRIRVQLYWQQDPEMTPWLRILSTHGGKSGGFFVIPEVGDEVMVGYELNHPDTPFVMGSLYHGKAKPSGNYQDKDNNIKGILTKSGNEITLVDTGGSEEIKISNKGGQNTITLTMSNGGAINISSCNEMTLSGKNININASEDFKLSAKNITMQAKQNVTMVAAEGSTLSTSKSSATIVADTTKVIASGDAGAAIVSGSKTLVCAGGDSAAVVSGNDSLVLSGKTATLTGDNMAKITGKNVEVEGSAGAAVIKGTFVQLN